MSRFVVGLTGGVASGKSALADRFAALGVTIADADVAAREAVAVGSEGLEEIVSAFGPEVLDEGGGRLAYPWLDRILVVDVPRDVQVARLLARDGVDLALANRMIDAQASRRERLAIADDIVANDGPIGHLDEVARELDALYRTLAAVGAA